MMSVDDVGYTIELTPEAYSGGDRAAVEGELVAGVAGTDPHAAPEIVLLAAVEADGGECGAGGALQDLRWEDLLSLDADGDAELRKERVLGRIKLSRVRTEDGSSGLE